MNPGDLIFADYDGIVAIPAEMIAEVFTQAKRRFSGRTRVVEICSKELFFPRYMRSMEFFSIDRVASTNSQKP